MVQNLCSQLCIPSFWDFTTRLLEACRQLTQPVDCASTGLYPSELHYHTLWWEGPDWLKLDESHWSCQPHALVHPVPQKEKTVSLHVQTESKPPVIPFTQYSNFPHLIHVTTWILQFIHNCQAKKHQIPKQLSFLTIQLIYNAETHWIFVIQHFSHENDTLLKCQMLHSSTSLLPLHAPVSGLWWSVVCRQQDFQLYW